ncbi:MAG: DUF3343 domain-containing protein [Clostridia bacterium]|nr:DUF3343 domain-containing protein [Clostridia bacterium]
MNKTVFLLDSVSYAIKLRRLLSRENIKSTLVKVVTSAHGCSHGVEVSDNDFYRVIVILKDNDMPYRIETKTK